MSDMMNNKKEAWRARIVAALQAVASDYGLPDQIDAEKVVVEIPPNPDLGDYGFPLFPFAKAFRKAPPAIAQAVAVKLSQDPAAQELGTAAAEGPYVNVRIAKVSVIAGLLKEALDPASSFGRPSNMAGKRIMVEFSSPNTNKPLHLGHLRNDVLGESLSRILVACGADVRKVCIINDRGVHICKSMLAYTKFFDGKTPESEGMKSDRFVGDCYVRFHQWSQEDPTAEAQAQDLLLKWEAGDAETVALWKRMNEWAVTGMKKTYVRTGVSFDTYYFESETYLKGKDEVIKGLEKGVFYREEDGSVWIDLTAEGLDKKVLLRKDGTALYMTQDIGTAIYRHRDWPFDQLVYVVGSEQQYHFKVLFRVLERLGFTWASSLFHLSYGMVNLPEGKMKSREGTVVDADDLIDKLRELALDEIREKGREEAVGDPEAIAERIALGALHYFLLQVTATKDMLFDPKESLSFTGNTGPYMQYMGARIHSILSKAEGSAAASGSIRPELLTGDAEWDLAKTIAACPEIVALAAERLDPSTLSTYLYDLSKAFSRFYHDCPILNAPDPDLAATRLALAKATLRALRGTLELACIPFLEAM